MDYSAPESEVAIKQEDIEGSEDDSRTHKMSLSEEAEAWDRFDMPKLEIIFNNMREVFQRVVFGRDSSGDPDLFDQDTDSPSEREKWDLQDACCYFLENEDIVPQVHKARANLMMVWLIDTETESERYAEQASFYVECLAEDVDKMFGVKDARVEGLKEDLYAALEEVVRRKAEGDAEMDEDEMEDEDEDEDDEKE